MNTIEQMIEGVLTPVEDVPMDMLEYVTDSGVLLLLGVELNVYRMSSGNIVVGANSLEELLNAMENP